MFTVQNLGIHGLSVSIFKMSAAENGKKLKLRIFNNFRKSASVCHRFKIFTLSKVRNPRKMIANSLLFNEGLKIQDGCQSWLLIVPMKIVHITLSTILKQLVLT